MPNMLPHNAVILDINFTDNLTGIDIKYKIPSNAVYPTDPPRKVPDLYFIDHFKIIENVLTFTGRTQGKVIPAQAERVIYGGEDAE